jgi:aminopeptidase N
MALTLAIPQPQERDSRMKKDAPKTIFRKDYAPPGYRIETVALDVALGDEMTRVKSRLAIRATSDNPGPLVLDGEGPKLVAIRLDGQALPERAYRLDEHSLTIHKPPRQFTLETEAEIRPQDNTALEGLYKSRRSFCTQCEAEGFRRITWYLDRPDVMAVFTTRISGDKKRYPVLLSNGNLVESGDLPGGTHYAVWNDPFPKPCYLFALVAGDLACAEDRFVTRSGRNVALRIFVEAGKQDRCGHALESLKKAMRWDEETFGLEYDLDIFMIVAVSDFNMGAMENKGLNVFNDKYILANPETATDADYGFIEAIIAHEYFHNWTGNRVTCRDWFQLSLKEGLTVFRDQLFSADMRSAPVERIKQVRALRARQFPEDAGPMAHPVRPDSYIEINNFYTATVYEKGAEVIRMMHALLGRDGFRKGMDLYFERHDGQAVTCEDFVKAMEDANGADLSQFRLWYSQSGTPELAVDGRYDAAAKAYDLTVRQNCPPTPGQPEKQPMHIPLAVGLIDGTGRGLPLRLDGENPGTSASRVLDIRKETETFRFIGIEEEPTPSLLRNFSAPVKLKLDLPAAQRQRLIAQDSDPFTRWETAQQYATSLLLEMIAAVQADGKPKADAAFIDALKDVLLDASLDKALIAETLVLPSEDYLAQQMAVVDVDAIHAARETLRGAIAERLKADFLATYNGNTSNRPYSPDPASAAQRRLRNVALGYLGALEDRESIALCAEQARAADNMTDQIGALTVLNDLADPARGAALDAFYARWKDDPLVIDKWFSLQAMSSLPGTRQAVEKLLTHPAFSIKTPNKVRALIGAFCQANPLRFHAADGSGYAFLADRVLELNRINPQVAARLVGAFGQWQRFDAARQAMMQAQLARVAGTDDLSPDVYEIASKTLGTASR